MRISRRLKIAFAILIIIAFIENSYYIYTFSRDEYEFPEIYTEYLHEEGNISSHSSHELDLAYLWRPNLTTEFQNTSDNIVAQLAWTEQQFASKEIENMRGKNILLVFGRNNWKFWHTNNEISCPGFSINSNKCKLKFSINLEETNLSPADFDGVIYSQATNRHNVSIPDYVKQITYTQESPYTFPMKIPKNNLLASYYRGSDIVLPYSKWIPYNSEESKYFNVNPSPSDLAPLKDYSKGKTGFAVIFSSKCRNIPSGRFKFIDELKKYISVDIFGNCGARPPCPKSSDKKECLNSVVRKYKFYLAFENSNCRDYITEKFFVNALENDVVPVVLGAHPDDYAYAAPPNSYISTQDFKSPKELAEYLITLDRNSTMYNEYFRWKGTGTFYDAWKDLFCRVCGLLFYADLVPPPSWKENTKWAKVNPCLPRGQWYWDKNKQKQLLWSYWNEIIGQTKRPHPRIIRPILRT